MGRRGCETVAFKGLYRSLIHASLCALWSLSHLISQFPEAYKQYAKKCEDVASLDHNLDACRQSLVGTCMIEYHPESHRYIASLITSLDYGKYVDTPAEILENTRKAFQSLKDRISQINADNATKGIDSIGEVWAVRLNSGLFKVPWEETRAVLEEEQEEEDGKKLQNSIRIVYRPEKDEGKPRKKARKRKSNYNKGTPVTPDSDDPIVYAKSVQRPRLRPSKGRMAINETNKSTRAERTVSSGRNKKAKNRDRQGDSPSRLEVERSITEWE